MTIPKTCTRFICMLLLICMALACVPQLLPPAQAASTTKGFTISAKNTTVFKDTAMKTKLGTIFPDDELILVQITNSYTKVTYGVTGTSRTKTGYIPTSAVLIKPSGSVITAGAKITTYRRNSTASTYGYIAKGDKVTILGTKGDFTQVKYPVSGGYKIAFVKTSALNTQSKSITVYFQAGQSWSSHHYGYATEQDENAKKHATIGKSGCGLLSIVNAVYYLNGKFIDPIMLADYSVASNNRPYGGTSDKLTKDFCGKYGKTYGIKFMKDAKTIADVKSNIQSGQVAVVHVMGHFVAVVDYNASTGKYLVLDSAPAAKRGTSGSGYRWMTAAQFTGEMAYSPNTSLPVHVIAMR